MERTPEEIRVAIDSAENQMELRKQSVLKGGGDPVRDAGVGFRLGQIDALNWALGLEDSNLEDAVEIFRGKGQNNG